MKQLFPPRLLLGCCIVLLQCSWPCLAAQQQRVVLHDPSQQALRSNAHRQAATAQAGTGILCAASGLVPPFAVDHSTSAEVEAVLQRESALRPAPKAVLLLHLAGVSPGEATSCSSVQQLCCCSSTCLTLHCPAGVLPRRHQQLRQAAAGMGPRVDGAAGRRQQPAGHVSRQLAAGSQRCCCSQPWCLSDRAGSLGTPGVSVRAHHLSVYDYQRQQHVSHVHIDCMLAADLSKAGVTWDLQALLHCYEGGVANDRPCLACCALQDCRAGHCLQQHLHKAMHHCGGKLHTPAQQHSPKGAGLQGALELPGLGQKLDMQLPGVKLFALELAALQASLEQQLAQLALQTAEQLDQVRPGRVRSAQTLSTGLSRHRF